MHQAADVLTDLYLRLAGGLSGIADELPKDYKLTLVARHTKMPGAGILLTDDDVSLVIAEIDKLKARPVIRA